MCRSNALWGVAALSLAALLAACGSSSSSKSNNATTPDTTATGGSMMLESYSGTQRAFDGTWSSCVSPNQHNVDELDVWVVTVAASNQSFTVSFDEYPLGSGCTGTKTHIVTMAGTGTVTSTKSGVTWTDGSSVGGLAPTRAGGGGTLPDPLTASVVSLNVASSDNTGTPLGPTPKMLYVDDSGAAWLLYAEKTGLPACDDGSAVGKCLAAMDEVIKQ